MQYYFEWDLKKAKENCRKHKVSFENSATIFLAPNFKTAPAVSIFLFERYFSPFAQTLSGILPTISKISEIS